MKRFSRLCTEMDKPRSDICHKIRFNIGLTSVFGASRTCARSVEAFPFPFPSSGPLTSVNCSHSGICSCQVAMATPLKRKTGDIATSTAKKPKANATITSFFSSPSSTAKPTPAAASTASSALPSSSPTTVPDDASQKFAASTTATAAPIFTSVEALAPPAKFDKGKWVEKLTPEQKDLLALEIASLDESWLSQLKDEIVTKDFLDLKRFLKKEHDNGKKIFPPAADVYSWYVRNHTRPHFLSSDVTDSTQGLVTPP